MTLRTLFPLALVCHCCSTSIPLFRSHSTLLRSFSPRHGLRYCSAQASTKATPAPQDDRRKRIEARTATLDDYRAEIAAQERELAAAVKEKSEVDDEIETAKAEIAIMVELKEELAQLATSIGLETDKQKEYLNQTKTFTTHIAAMRADIETLKSQRQALEQQMGK